MWNQARTALLWLAVFTFLTGLVYPLAVTAAAQFAFPRAANGSLIERNGAVVGSELIGQSFTSGRYFWSRPSATIPAYAGGASAGSNLGPTNAALLGRVGARVAQLRAAHPSGGSGGLAPATTSPSASALIPVDLATTSASGLDPHLSPAAAGYQVERVAAARGLAAEVVAQLVRDHVEARQFGVLGEPRVNVLALNLALDELAAR